jgi:hypothetical protein
MCRSTTASSQDATAARVVLDDVDELHQQQRLFRRLDAVLIQVLQQRSQSLLHDSLPSIIASAGRVT